VEDLSVGRVILGVVATLVLGGAASYLGKELRHWLRRRERIKQLDNLWGAFNDAAEKAKQERVARYVSNGPRRW
jgi:hypothetical protein